jgi:hypothetical protein
MNWLLGLKVPSLGYSEYSSEGTFLFHYATDSSNVYIIPKYLHHPKILAGDLVQASLALARQPC